MFQKVCCKALLQCHRHKTRWNWRGCRRRLCFRLLWPQTLTFWLQNQISTFMNPDTSVTQNWIKFPWLVFEIWCSQGFEWDAQTHKLIHRWTDPNTRSNGGRGLKNIFHLRRFVLRSNPITAGRGFVALDSTYWRSWRLYEGETESRNAAVPGSGTGSIFWSSPETRLRSSVFCTMQT